MLPHIADVIGNRYRLEGRIAAGGMGEVWRAVDLVLDRPVAVKVLPVGYADYPETLARFRAEARHAAALSHPHIAQVYDYGDARADRPAFLVMELVSGPPLSAVLARGPLDPVCVLDVIAQAAAGLHAAHAAGLVHRDIKPGNLLLSANGMVKITDFGIAHATGSAPLTRTGTLIGTPAYLAPERVAGGGAVPASDLYSLGIVAYECLTGTPPFTGTVIEVALAHRHAPLPPLPPTVPPQLAALVTELTARDPAKRPATAGEVAARAASLRAVVKEAAPTLPEPAAAPAAPGHLATRSGKRTSFIFNDTLSEVSAPGTDLDAGRASGPAPRLPGSRRQDVLHPAAFHAVADRLAALRLARPAWLPAPVRTRERRAAAFAAHRATPGPFPPLRQAPERHAALPGTLRPRSARRAAVYAAAAVAMISGLVGGLASGAPGAAPAGSHSAADRQVITATTDRMVQVHPGTLIGRPVAEVIRRLQRLGLRVQLGWARSHSQAPGMVLSVGPSGSVPAGTTVLVTVATRPPGKPHPHKHHGNGGHDQGPGPGGDGHGGD